MLSIRPAFVRFGEFRIENQEDKWSQQVQAEMAERPLSTDILDIEKKGYHVSISLEKPENYFKSQQGTYNVNLISKADPTKIYTRQITKAGGIPVFIASLMNHVNEMLEQATGKDKKAA